LERDEGSSAIDGYLPVGRAIEVINRLASAMSRPEAEVAISVTGPYGSGKSSLALIIDALFGPEENESTRSASEIVGASAPDTLKKILQARQEFGAGQDGFIRAVATAQREPIISTVLRALHHGATRFQDLRPSREMREILIEIEEAMSRLSGAATHRPSSSEIRILVSRLGSLSPVLLIIDEFGKNLEAFADAHSEADLYLLQDLAEWTRGEEGIRLALVTLQHMAFDEYSSQTSVSQRREWAKIQGRFEDIPFVDSAAQTRSLIASAFEPAKQPLAKRVTHWVEQQVQDLRELGLTDLAMNADQIEAAWPLHPLAYASLPELCERYGQNERTLFSFIASHEPLSIVQFLETTDLPKRGALPAIFLERLYDYFIESASNLVSISTNATRWLEIDSRVRDATGLSDSARRVLKTVGLLNLISAGGTLRASKAIVAYAANDGGVGTDSEESVLLRLAELELAGLVTYRDFADEYRIWNGTDFNIRTAIDLARRRVQAEQPSALLSKVMKLPPIIAARHSYESGTLRAFKSGWVDETVLEVSALTSRDRFDGLVLFSLSSQPPIDRVVIQSSGKPVVFASSSDTSKLFNAAIEVAAIDEVLGNLDSTIDDWVARRELIERRVEAAAELQKQFHQSFSGGNGEWIGQCFASNSEWRNLASGNASAATSQIADEWYSQSPIIRNDLINRHELSSQSAKARRVLLEQLISRSEVMDLDISGFGPEKTMYLSFYRENGMHHKDGRGNWKLSAPGRSSSFNRVWRYLNEIVSSSSTSRIRVSQIYEDLSCPPFGIRAGVAPLFLVHMLQMSGEEVALYEHGTYIPVMSDDVLERLLKNPHNFEIKFFASRSGARGLLVAGLYKHFSSGSTSTKAPSLLRVVATLIRTANALNEYSLKTSFLSKDAAELRKVLLNSTEPDQLLFSDLPAAFGVKEFRPGSRASARDISRFVERVMEAVADLNSSYPSLIKLIAGSLESLTDGAGITIQTELRLVSEAVKDRVSEPRLRSLCVALRADLDDFESWLEYVAMSVVGKPPASWSDSDRARFESEILELGTVLLRIFAMHTELPEDTQERSNFRQFLTRGDGTEEVFVISLTGEQTTIIESAAEKLVASVSRALRVDIEAAKKMASVVLADTIHKA
jgi:ABC-type molybdenum transport system ATPase subunit/photorepair protein PhrA